MDTTQMLQFKINKLHNQVTERKERKYVVNQNDLEKASELLQDIDSTLDDLKNLQEKIHTESSLLETEVFERTKELQLTNHRLELEIIERQKIQEQLTFLTYHDKLTGLPNRLLLTERLNQEILQANRQDQVISILFINLDGFKLINDTIGYDQGDELLKQVSKRLLTVSNQPEILSHLGGDEFIIYLNHSKDEGNLDRIASKVVDLFNYPFVLRDQEYFITVSMGISQYPIDGEDVDTLIKHAEMATHKAKSLGKNQYVKCSNELKNENLETTSLTNNLYQAIEHNEMLLYYQPKVNGLTGNIVGVEALLRWKHPEHGFVPPSKFIPLAEKTRLILPIGYWVLKTASKQWEEWQDNGLQPITIAVNFSVHQLNHPSIIEQIEEVLEKTSLQPKHLEIEVTESLAMNHNGKIKETLERIKSLGITLSIDDFGKEYSSLNRLKELPIDRVKIDMSFVHGIGISAKDETIIKSILSLASNLGLETVAEGVETKEQLDFLNQTTCDQLQGYYFYKPMPATEIEKLLSADHSNNGDVTQQNVFKF